MTLYLVKWNDGSSALVTAEDQEHLFDVLDQLGNPHAASWVEYSGPLWLEFGRVDTGVPVGDVDPLERRWLRAELPGTDWADEFGRTIAHLLHPEYEKIREAALDQERLMPRPEFERAGELTVGIANRLLASRWSSPSRDPLAVSAPLRPQILP
ncbi:MAG: hypothetical protein GXP62_04230 [Oligoflexia bacterium]|nr:hypothetical protein [Oligoflexia bacterium]